MITFKKNLQLIPNIIPRENEIITAANGPPLNARFVIVTNYTQSNTQTQNSTFPRRSNRRNFQCILILLKHESFYQIRL